MKNETTEKETERRGTSALTRLLAPRTIKFRALSNGNWQYGHYYNNKDCAVNQDIIVSDRGCKGVEYIVDSRTVCEFTGLKDKNGKEIYEGDIVNVFEEWEFEENEDMGNHLVVWGGKDYPAFTLKPGLGTEENVFSYLNLVAHYEEKFKVIGNIFENPELLDECT